MYLYMAWLLMDSNPLLCSCGQTHSLDLDNCTQNLLLGCCE